MSPTFIASTTTAELKYLLIDSHLAVNAAGDPALTFRVLPGQLAFEQQLPEELTNLLITLDVADFTRRPMGTVMISDDFTMLEPMAVHINKVRPLFLNGTPMMAGSTMDEKMIEQVDYLLSYLHQSDNPSYGPAFAEQIADHYAAYGYEVDWDVLLAGPEPEPEPEPEAVEEQEAEVPMVNASGLVTGVSGLLERLLDEHPCPPPEKYGFFIEPRVWQKLIRARHKKKSVMFTGPTGCGKTELARFMALEFGEQLHIQDMGTISDVQSALVGVHRLDHQGHSQFDPAPFVGYIQSGSFVLLDEINRSPLSASNLMFPCLDSRRYLPVDIAGEGEERHIKVHPETWFIGTANLGAEYGGTQTIDRAFKDRFQIIELTYMSQKDEIRMLRLRTGIDEANATTIVKLAFTTREMALEQELSEAVSTRTTLETAEAFVDGFTLAEAIEAYVLPLFDNDGSDSERSKVLGLVASF